MFFDNRKIAKSYMSIYESSGRNNVIDAIVRDAFAVEECVTEGAIGITRNTNVPFISDMEKEYPPQTREQERSMIDDYMSRGDEKGLKEQLVNHNMGLIRSQMGKYYDGYNGDVDSLVSVGIAGLQNAAKTFDVTRGTKFSTYAVRGILDEFKRQLKNHVSSSAVVNNGNVKDGGRSLDEPINSVDGELETDFGDFVYRYADDKSKFTNDVIDENPEVRRLLLQMFGIAGVTGRERETFLAIYSTGIGQKEYAEQHGMKKQSVNYLIQNALKKIREKVLEPAGIMSFSDYLEDPGKLKYALDHARYQNDLHAVASKKRIYGM